MMNFKDTSLKLGEIENDMQELKLEDLLSQNENEENMFVSTSKNKQP